MQGTANRNHRQLTESVHQPRHEAHRRHHKSDAQAQACVPGEEGDPLVKTGMLRVPVVELAVVTAEPHLAAGERNGLVGRD